MIMTVGDQIFALNQEVKRLKKRCQEYETALRDVASGKSTLEVTISSHSMTCTGGPPREKVGRDVPTPPVVVK